MAALPRKSDPDGAASLPWRTIALARGSASREFGKMMLQNFSFGSATEVLDDDSNEEGNGVEVGFGFGDGYDFGSAACESSLKSASNGGGAGVAIEADIGEVGGKGGVVCKDQAAVVRVSAVVCSVLCLSAPVPDSEVGAACPGADATEAERADEAGEIEGRVGAESERADRFIECSTHGQTAAIEVDGGVVVDGVLRRDKEGAAVDIDDCAVAEGASGCGLEGAAIDRGGASEAAVVAGEDLGAGAVFDEGGAGATGNATGVGGVAACGAKCEGIGAEGDI